MKKILISVLIVLLALLAYFLIFNNIHLGNWKSTSVNNIKEMNGNLDGKISTAEAKIYQEYPASIETLETALSTLRTTKENYEKKTSTISDEIELGVVKLKEYKIERLWIALANYAKREKIELKVDLVETSVENVYNLNITLTGDYIGITDFIYDIEKDDTLGFKIMNFKLSPSTSTSSSNTDGEETTTTTVSLGKLTATFEIQDVGIDLS